MKNAAWLPFALIFPFFSLYVFISDTVLISSREAARRPAQPFDSAHRSVPFLNACRLSSQFSHKSARRHCRA